MSALAAMAHRRPEVIADHIRDNGDGTFTVRFYERRLLRSPKPVDIVDSAEFPAKSGRFLFAQPGDRIANRGELWPMLYEKAWAHWKGRGDCRVRQSLNQRQIDGGGIDRLSGEATWHDIRW